jgi:hypothetical protein
VGVGGSLEHRKVSSPDVPDLVSDMLKVTINPHPVRPDAGPVAAVLHKAVEAGEARRDRSPDSGRTPE